MVPHGRCSLDGSEGPTPQTTVRLPRGLQRRAVQVARWRGTSLSTLLREGLERYVHELEELERAHAEALQEARRRAVAAWGRAWTERAFAEPAAELLTGYADGDAGTVAEDDD